MRLRTSSQTPAPGTRRTSTDAPRGLTPGLKAREDQVAAQRDKQRKTEQARKDEEQRKRQAAQQATRRAAAAKKQADEHAAKREQDAEAAKRAEQAKINAREQEVAAPATAELKDATAKKTAATEQRSDADAGSNRSLHRRSPNKFNRANAAPRLLNVGRTAPMRTSRARS